MCRSNDTVSWSNVSWKTIAFITLPNLVPIASIDGKYCLGHFDQFTLPSRVRWLFDIQPVDFRLNDTSVNQVLYLSSVCWVRWFSTHRRRTLSILLETYKLSIPYLWMNSFKRWANYFQAILCQLAEVSPVDAEWSDAAVERFSSIVTKTNLMLAEVFDNSTAKVSFIFWLVSVEQQVQWSNRDFTFYDTETLLEPKGNGKGDALRSHYFFV